MEQQTHHTFIYAYNTSLDMYKRPPFVASDKKKTLHRMQCLLCHSSYHFKML